MESLVAPEGLVGDAGDVTFLDVRWALGRTDGREQFESGHVPGAVYVDLETDLADPPHTGSGGRHPLPQPDRFGAAMRRCGVRHDRPVVVYDAVGGTSAARAWWLLRHHGHPDVRVLDGGWPAWRSAGGAVETGPSSPSPGDFVPAPGRLPVLDAEAAARVAADGVLVDARAPERFRGETEPVDPVAGHIPGAVNVPAARSLRQDGPGAGRLRPVAELEEIYAAAVGAAGPVAAYCGSGVTAAHAVLALDQLGVSAALYAGSWSDWVSDPSRPVAVGD